jgi:hypothetical protein
VEDANLRRLYPYFDGVILLQLARVLRDDGHAALPDTFVLTADADAHTHFFLLDSDRIYKIYRIIL